MLRPISSAVNVPNSDTCTNNNSISLLEAFVDIWQSFRYAFAERRTHDNALAIALGLLTAFGRRTITRGICAINHQFEDWSATYRLFSMHKWSPLVLQHSILCHCARYLEEGLPLVIALDDSHAKKTGKHIPSSGYFYDPASPHFARSFAWALRFISASVILTPYGHIGPARGIPIRWSLAPAIKKPKKRAPKEAHLLYRKMTQIWSVTSQAVEQLSILRSEMDAEPALHDRTLVISADSGYCNKTVFAGLPERTVLVARTRKDIKLFAPPMHQTSITRGRRKAYGEPLPTPEEIRKNDSYPWRKAVIFAAGDWHEFNYKTIAPVMWKNAGANRKLRLLVIRPLHYRKTARSRLLYRDPAYLLISDPDYPVERALQDYCHRWEIEVNHRDLKDVIGIGDAQVRNPMSVSRQPAFISVLYSCLLLASMNAYGPGRGEEYLPYPKWRNIPGSRPSILDLVAQLRRELWLSQFKSTIKSISEGSSLNTNTLKYLNETGQWSAEAILQGLSPPMISSILYAYA